MKPSVVDVIQNAINDKPAEAKEALADVMLDKIRERLEAKREEMAHKFYGNDEEGPEDIEDEESEDESDYVDDDDFEDFEDDETDEDHEESDEDTQ